MSENYKVCLLSDFNARTGCLFDFTLFEDVIAVHNFDLDLDFAISENNLEALGLPIERKSSDKHCNNYGYRLIKLCKSFDIHIAMVDVEVMLTVVTLLLSMEV